MILYPSGGGDLGSYSGVAAVTVLWDTADVSKHRIAVILKVNQLLGLLHHDTSKQDLNLQG